MRINSSTNYSASCEKLVKIGPVVFELKWSRKWNIVLRPKFDDFRLFGILPF